MKHVEDILSALATPSSTAPASPDVGDFWHDSRTGETLVWDGTYWRSGNLARVETLVDIGVAAADHDIGWDVPAGFVVIKQSVKILKALTGAGGAVKAGMGTKVAGDPDKYGLTADLLADTTDQAVHGVWADGAGDDLGITACDAAGAALGTLEGSDDEDVQVMVWMLPVVTL
jgi:hypothetical protein